MSLKALASETLARLRGTEDGTLLEQLEQGGSCSNATPICSIPLEHDFPQKSAKDEPCSTVPLSRAGTSGTTLSDDLILGLKRLRAMPLPRIRRPELWGEIKADALRIATDGWAAQAMALGWSALDLFGVEPSSDPDEFSLAVDLASRPILAVDERRFYLRKGDVRSFFERRERPALTKYLWEL